MQQHTEHATYHYNITESNPLVAEDYPWGFKLRTKQRYWVETKATHGQRFVYQTLNPRTNHWCKPKKGTYSAIVIPYVRKEDGHIKYTGISRYAEVDTMEAFLANHKDYLDTYQLSALNGMIGGSKAYSAAFKAAKDEAINEVKTEIDLNEKLIWSKSEITKSPLDLELIAIDVSVVGVKKRCRKADRHYKRIGFFAPNALVEDNMPKFKEACNAYIGENFRITDNSKMVLKNTKFIAPENGSMFYSMREMLMDNIATVAL